MLARLRCHLSFANVVPVLALLIALGGGAYAVTLPRNSVGASQLKKNAVTSSKIKAGADTHAHGSRSRHLSRTTSHLGPGQASEQAPPLPRRWSIAAVRRSSSRAATKRKRSPIGRPTVCLLAYG